MQSAKSHKGIRQ